MQFLPSCVSSFFSRTTTGIVGAVQGSCVQPTPVYNLTVEGTNNYFANGVLVHNCIIDDPHSEQDARKMDPSVYEAAYEWYMPGPRQRLQPGGRIIVISTRWSRADLIGRLLEDAKKNPKADQWEVIELPALTKDDQPLWPEFWPVEELLALRATLSKTYPHLWWAQYMQQPTGEANTMVKREWWKPWPHDTPPKVEYIMQSWDTAFTKTTRSNMSACTTWGIWEAPQPEGLPRRNIILLDAWRDKVEFPDLKKKAKELYKFHRPDTVIIEAKAAGWPLIQELRQSGIPVQDYTPQGSVNTGDKTDRKSVV